MLQIISPSTENEHTSHIIALLVEVFGRDERQRLRRWFYDVQARGSGAQLRARCLFFYVQNEEHVRGKPRIGLNVDPPPDLVIEVDITSPPLDKLPIDAQIGVPKVWRCDGRG